MAFVKTEVQGAVEIITIDRPKALNALNPEVLADLKAAMTGMGKLSIIRNTSLPSLPKASPSALVMVLMEPMSAPATKLLSPSPVRTMQRMVS